MPKIEWRWERLPPALQRHLIDRVDGRKISAEELLKLRAWSLSNPELGLRLLQICGQGKYPKTFLLRGEPARGERL